MQSAKILIVEDESITALAIKHKLKRLGYSVLAIESCGIEAIKKTAQLEPDLILMNIALKGNMEGIETAHKINKRFNIPIIYLTAYCDDDILEKAKLTNPYGYINTPFSDTDLKIGIKNGLYRHQFELEDINKRNKAEEKLKESEEKYRTLFNLSPDNVILIGVDGKLLDVNDTALENTGLRASDLIGKHFKDLKILPEEDMFLHIKKVSQILNGKAIGPYESRFIDKDGQIRFVETHIKPLEKDGNLFALQIISHDINNRKKAENALKLSEAYYRTIFENTGTVTLIIEENMIISLMNHEAEKFSGYSKGEIEGKRKWSEFIANKDDLQRMEEYKNLRINNSNSAPRNYEFQIKTKDNIIKDAFVTVSVIPGTDKSLVSLLDVTEKRRSRKAFIESEQKYRQLVENAHEGICSIDLEGAITFVNPRMAEILGYTVPEMLKKSFESFIDEKFIGIVQNHLKSPAKAFKGHYDFEFIKKDGETVYTSIETSIILDENGNEKGILALVADITERKKTEEELKESEEKFREVFNNANDMIFLYELSEKGMPGNFIEVNDVACGKLNYNAYEMCNKTFLDIALIQKDVKMNHISEKMLNGEHAIFDADLIGSAGNKIPVEINNHFFKLKNAIVGLAIARDITERKKAENALKENERYMKTILATIQTGIVVIDAKTKEIIDVNRAAINLIGGIKEDIIGKKCHKFICPYEDGKCPITDLNQKIDNSERILLTLNNEEIPIIKSVVPVTLKGRKCILDSFIDISELKKLGKSLKESKEKYKALIKASPEAVVVTDLYGNITFASPKTLELYGFERKEELIDKNAFEFIAPECHEKAISDVEKIIEENTHRNLVYKFIKNDGTPFIGELNLSIIKDNKREPQSVIFILRDITEIRKAEKQIKRANIYHQGLIEASLDPLVTIGENGKITDVNSATETITGYSRNELIGTDFSDYFTEPKKAREGYQRVFNDSIVKNYELEIKHKDGHIIPVSYNASVYKNENDEVIGVFAAARDITEIKKAEKNIKNSLKEKEVLLREIHHRVKNNLQIISSLLSLQSSYINDNEALDVFKESQNRVKSMAMIHEMLYKSDSLIKINFGHYINELTNNLVYNYKISPNIVQIEQNIDNIYFDVNTSIPCGLIVNELVSNSLKHAFPRFKTSELLRNSFNISQFDQGKINIELKADDDNYIITIADNGIGFPDNIDFRKTDSLGLELVNNLVEQLDGSIELDKTGGTKFTINFKLDDYDENI